VSCLTVVQEACDQLQGITRPTSVVSSSDPGVQQMLRLLNQAGRSLARDHDWSSIVVVRNFTGLAQQAQTGEPPAAFDRFVSGGQIFDVDRKLPLSGSIDQSRFQWLTLQIMGGIDRYWAIIDGVINITPAPTGTETYRYSYVSKNWCAGGDKFTADTDTSELNEELLTLSLIWRWNRAKGLDYAEDMRNFELEKERMIARDKGPRSINTAHIFDTLPGSFWPDHIG
jgi:hypothetical protein